MNKKLEKAIEDRQGDAMCTCGQCNLSSYNRLISYGIERDFLIDKLKKAVREGNDGGIPA